MGVGRLAYTATVASLVLIHSGCHAGFNRADSGSEQTSGIWLDSTGLPETDSDHNGDGSSNADVRWVELDPPALRLDPECVGTAEGDIRFVAPGGALWAIEPVPDGTLLHVYSPGEEPTTYEVAGRVQQGIAWSRSRATLIVDGAAAVFDAGTLEPLRWPENAPSAEAICGQPGEDGDGLILARDVYDPAFGQWWRWNLPPELFTGHDEFATVSGSCAGRDSVTWMRLDSAVWRATPASMERVPGLEPASDLVADSSFGAASVVDGELILAQDGQLERVAFEAGDVTSVSAAPGRLWVSAGERIYLYESESFLALEGPAGVVRAQRLWADSTRGVWTDDSISTCRWSEGPPIDLEGIRPFQRQSASEIEVLVRGSFDELHMMLDGQSIAPKPMEEGWGATLQDLETGWHELSIVAETEHGEALRRTDFLVEGEETPVWTGRIQTLAVEHCAGEGCHGPDAPASRPDLTRYENWLSLADVIYERVVEKASMPPLGGRKDSWGIDDVLLLATWINAGMPKEGHE